MFQIVRKDGIGETLTVDVMGLMGACAQLSGGGTHPLDVTDIGDATPAPVASPVSPVATATPAVSTWTHQVTDQVAKARAEAQQAALVAAGVKLDTSEQAYATGTRMAAEGYAEQAKRAREHAALMPLSQAIDSLRAAVESEGREDRTVSAAELGRSLSVNGKITAFGLRLSEHAIRGLAARLESPMMGYILGMRERIATAVDAGDLEAAKVDRRMVAEVLAHECARKGEVTLKLRTRAKLGDIYATVSPAYTAADAPDLLAEITPHMPDDAKGSWSYDPTSTAWELRGSIWTPTPTAEQCVGEPFEGYVSFHSRDAGNGKLRGGGGATLLRCLNASTYTAEASSVARAHRSRVLADIPTMVRQSLRAIDTLCSAWGVARKDELTVPTGVKLNDAIPGFWRYCLTARGSELAGVLPGRTEKHVEGLTAAFHGERRDASKLVRSDLAQGWTRYIQSQPGDIRRDGEGAIGAWLVSPQKVGCELRA